MRKIEFFITRRGDLHADGELISSFGDEATAADMAVRFAQDNECPYSLLFQ